MLSSIGLGLLLICCVNLGGRAWTREEELQYKTESRCRCQSTDRCWPSPREWTALNALVNGNLLALRPVASVCHDPTFDEAVCENVSASYTSAAWRADQPAALQQVQWETYPPANESCYLEFPRNTPCQQGRVSLYSVVASTPSHIRRAVKFASRNNLRLVIKNTGHDWVGRSSARSSLQIWTHKFKDVAFSNDFSPKGCRTVPCRKRGACNRGPAVTIGAGVQMLELYQAAKDRGLTVAAAGGGGTVGAAGGYLQGGGHSLLGNLLGASTDNVLQFEVVTASGKLETANQNVNPNLFWALRGGGGGTYAIVTSVTLRTFPDPTAVTVDLSVRFPRLGPAYWAAVQELNNLLPAIDDGGGSGFYYLFPNLGVPEAGANFIAGMFFPNETDVGAINRLWAPFETKVTGMAGSNVSVQVKAVPKFSDALFPLLRATEQTVPITIFGSRLISRDFLTTVDGPKNVSDVLSSLRHPPGLSVIGLVVAGGQLARNGDGVVDSALNPAWRRTLLHLQLLRGWTVDTPFAQQAAIQKNLTDVEAALLRSLEGADSMGVYFNEADPNEPDWPRAFFGDNYERLRQVKRMYDRDTLFICRRCVGSEGWDDEGLCRVSS